MVFSQNSIKNKKNATQWSYLLLLVLSPTVAQA